VITSKNYDEKNDYPTNTTGLDVCRFIALS
jgi:hypothetical protein